MIIVEKQAECKDVGGGQVGLCFQEVAAPAHRVCMRIGGKLSNIYVVVLNLKAVVEPGAVAQERAGECEARNELVKANAIEAAERRNEVRGIEAELVVAHA